MDDVICPLCGRRNPEFNPRCEECGTLLPPSSSGRSERWSGSSGAEEAAEPAPEESLVGRFLDCHRVIELIGRGGMGEVYRAYDESLERPVAIKVVRPDKSASDELRARFRREARAARELDHPTIVHIYDVLELEEGHCIVMELVEGRTLAALLADGAVDLPRIVSLAREVAEGLAVAHERGIVHRDLKVENVMVTPAGHAKILDFGLAKRFSLGDKESTHSEVSLTVDGGVVGTFRAMSPEQAQSLEVDHRSDLFSLGILLYESTTGRSPFRRGGLAATLAQLCIHRQTPARELNPEVPESLSGLIDYLLEKDPNDRPEDAGEVVAALEDVLIELAGARER